MRKRFAALGCLLAAGMLSGVAGCAAKEQGQRGAENAPVVRGVATEEVRAVAVADELEAVGTVRARTTAPLAARIAGTVGVIHVREGDRVGRGQLLLTIESAEGNAAAAAASAAVEEAQRGVTEARARRQLADATFARYKKLFEEQAVTRQEFDGKSTEMEVAAAGLGRAEARLVQARETARAAGTVAGYTKVTAPVGGIVTAKAVDGGMTVFPGTALLTVEEEGHYRLEVAAPETLAGRVKTGNALRVAIDGVAPGVTGRVAEAAPVVDPASRTFIVKVDIAGPGLRSGMYGRAFFPVGQRQALLVPRGAVVERGALTSVWVVEGGSIVRMRLVKVGKESGGRVEVLAGLSPGEKIVTGGMEKVTDGVRVE